jgi:hypothetical protein
MLQERLSMYACNCRSCSRSVSRSATNLASSSCRSLLSLSRASYNIPPQCNNRDQCTQKTMSHEQIEINLHCLHMELVNCHPRAYGQVSARASWSNHKEREYQPPGVRSRQSCTAHASCLLLPSWRILHQWAG